MTPDQAAALLDAMVDLLGALAVADEAKARLPTNAAVVERALLAVHQVGLVVTSVPKVPI